MIRRIKYRLLRWLTTDILHKLSNKRGYTHIGDLRASAQIEYMAMEAWEFGKWNRKEDK